MDNNEKIKLGCAVLCEGKYDKIKLSSVIDGMILTTDGFGVFNNAEKRSLLRKLCETRGLVIITDSDKAGFFIRAKLKGMLPQGRVRHLYIPQIKGREKRKTHDSKDGLLGVEGIDTQTLRKIILDAKLDESFGVCADKNFSPVTKAQFFELGLSGGCDSTVKRAELCKKLGLPPTLTANALLCALEMFGKDYSCIKALMREDGAISPEEYISFFPETARLALNHLKDAGFEAYFVGGCVRDLLMKRTAHDFDLTTNAPSEKIIEVLQGYGYDAFLVGGDCGTVCAKQKDGLPLEITPFRSEGQYRDHRHPERVTFVQDIRDDLSRRDFTVNSLALTQEKDKGITVTDLFDGVGDIKRKLIKCVGKAHERFEEDALRILRALRFACRFGFDIEENTACAMKDKAHLLSFISGERKQAELRGLLENPLCERLTKSFEEVLFNVLGQHSADGIDPVCGAYCEKLFFMLKDNSRGQISAVLDELKSSKNDRDRILGFKDIYDSDADIFTLTAKYGYFYAEYLKAFGGYEKASELFSDKSIPKTLKELDIDGKELSELGFCGKEIGQVLSMLLYDAICKKTQNNKQALAQRAKQYREESFSWRQE